MDEIIEQAASLDQRAVAAKASKHEAGLLIEEFKAFINARVNRYSVNADAMLRDEMSNTAMLAFYEAIQKYNETKGHFLPFASVVISKRLIDYNRKSNSPDIFTVSLDDDDEEYSAGQSHAISELSLRVYESERKREDLAHEIEQFKEELSEWGLTFASLVDQSPKHSRLRDEYKAVIIEIMQSADILQTIQVKRYFPIKAIANITGLPQKKLERARNYILASLIIKMGDYDLLAEYVSDKRGSK